VREGDGRAHHVVRHQGIEEPLPRQREEQVAQGRVARHDHVQRGFQPDEPWQPLRAGRARQDADAHLGQRHLRARLHDAVVAAHCKLEAAAHHHPVDRRHHRRGGSLDQRDHLGQFGRGGCLGQVELTNVRTSAEGTAAAGEHDGAHRRIGLRAQDRIGNEAPVGQAEAVDGRVVHGHDGNAFVHLVACGHGVLSVRVAAMFVHARRRKHQQAAWAG
jgi:hypothetical protein